MGVESVEEESSLIKEPKMMTDAKQRIPMSMCYKWGLPSQPLNLGICYSLYIYRLSSKPFLIPILLHACPLPYYEDVLLGLNINLQPTVTDCSSGKSGASLMPVIYIISPSPPLENLPEIYSDGPRERLFKGSLQSRSSWFKSPHIC